MKKIKSNKELPTENMLQLQSRHTLMENGDSDIWDSRKPYSRANSSCSGDKNGPKAKNFSPDSSATFSNASTVVITESELSSSWLYKNKKEQMNNNIIDPKDQGASNKERNRPQVHRPRVKSAVSEHERPKKSSCWCYTLIILAICLASLSILAGIASVFYMELFSGYDNTNNQTLDPKDLRSTSGIEPIRKVGQSMEESQSSLPPGQENFQEISHGYSVIPTGLLPANKMSDSSNERKYPNANPETEVEDSTLKIDGTTTEETKRLKIPNIIPNVVSFFVDSFIPKDRNNKTGDTLKDEQKQNVLQPINNFLFNKDGNSPYSKLFEFYNNFHKASSGTPKPISEGDDRGEDSKFEVGTNFNTDSDKLQEVNKSDITSSVNKNIEISKEDKIINLGGVITITEDNRDKQNSNINSDMYSNVIINHVFDEKKDIDSDDIAVNNISDSNADLKQNSELESIDSNQFAENSFDFDQVKKHKSQSEDKVKDDIKLNHENVFKTENNDIQTNSFDLELVKSLVLKPEVEDKEDKEETNESENKKSEPTTNEIPDVETSNENKLVVGKMNKDSDTSEASKEETEDEDDVLEMHPLKPSDFEDLDSSLSDQENEQHLDNGLEIVRTEMPEEEITELSNLFKTMNQNHDLDNDLSLDSNAGDEEEPHWNRPIFETAVPGPFDMMKRLNMEQENRIKQSEVKAVPSEDERQFSLGGALERLRSLDISNILPTSRMSTKKPPTRDQPPSIKNQQDIAKEQNRYLTHLRQLFFDK